MELQHYESRLLKLRHLQADHVSTVEKHHSKVFLFIFFYFILVLIISFLPHCMYYFGCIKMYVTGKIVWIMNSRKITWGAKFYFWIRLELVTPQRTCRCGVTYFLLYIIFSENRSTYGSDYFAVHFIITLISLLCNKVKVGSQIPAIRWK